MFPTRDSFTTRATFVVDTNVSLTQTFLINFLVSVGAHVAAFCRGDGWHTAMCPGVFWGLGNQSHVVICRCRRGSPWCSGRSPRRRGASNRTQTRSRTRRRRSSSTSSRSVLLALRFWEKGPWGVPSLALYIYIFLMPDGNPRRYQLCTM